MTYLETTNRIQSILDEEVPNWNAIRERIRSRIEKEIPHVVIRRPRDELPRVTSQGPKVIDFPKVDLKITCICYVAPIFTFEVKR